MESFEDIWKAVKAYCKNNVAETAYNLWIDIINFEGYENGSVTLSFPNAFAKNLAVPQYGALIEEAFEITIGFKVKVNYISLDKEMPDDGDLTYKDKQHMEDYRNEQFTFENFIVGPSNRFAYSAAKAVATNPVSTGQGGGDITFSSYNPLFIYGNAGLGKTHLLNAICHEVKKSFPDISIVYVRAEDWANELYQAIQNHNTDEFHKKYRNNIDLFLIDDIQFISGKQQTEEEFFHTFDSLVCSGKQVVITSDRPPKDIQSLTDRLKSRFEDGLLADIQPPEYETRCEIIKRKAALLNFTIDEPVVRYIAENIKSNIRQLEGVTKKLAALCEINKSPATIAMAKNVVKVVTEDTEPLPITIGRIIDEVCRTTGVSSENIYSEIRKANISHARKITFYVVRQITGMSYEDIGKEFSKHHSTVMYNINQIEDEIQKNSKLSRQINDIISNIKSSQ
jgi:chromosomal replication initiator protein